MSESNIKINTSDSTFENIKNELAKNKYPKDLNYTLFLNFIMFMRKKQTNYEITHYLDSSPIDINMWNQILDDMRPLASKAMKNIFTRIKNKLMRKDESESESLSHYNSNESLSEINNQNSNVEILTMEFDEL